MKNGNIIVAVVMLMCGLVVGLILFPKSSGDKPKAEVEVGPKWRVSDDMVPDTRGTNIHIISDPHGQKFLYVVNSRGVAMIPYVEQK